MTTPGPVWRGDRMSHARKLVSEWNKQHRIGTPVRYWPVVREDGTRPVPATETATRSAAWVDAALQAVVLLDGKSGYVSLEHVEPMEVGP